MRPQRLKIGQISKMFGIAPETLRYYERKKLISLPEREDNNYRSFYVSDTCIVANARTYMKYGFSLEEAQDMLAHPDIDYTLQKLEQQAAFIKERIYQELSVLHSLEAKLEGIRAVEANQGHISLKIRPAMYSLEIFKGDQLLPDEEGQYPLWHNNQDITFAYIRFSKEDFGTLQFSKRDICRGISTQDAISLGIAPSGRITLLPACPCLYTTTIGSASEETFHPMLTYLSEHNLKIAGDVVWKTIAIHKTSDPHHHQYYRELYVPVI